jgi:hypothetical protein
VKGLSILTVPILLTLLGMIAGIALVAFGVGSAGRALHYVLGGAALLVTLAATAATTGLFWLGQKNNWTSDGPGMLFVMIAIVVCGIVAGSGWRIVFAVARRAAAPPESLPEAPGDRKPVLRLAGFALLAIAAGGLGITACDAIVR